MRPSPSNGGRKPQQHALPPIQIKGLRRKFREDVYHLLLSSSWVQFFGLVAAGFLGANALFALAYVLLPGSILNARSGSFEDAFFFSVQTMATIGYGSMAPATLPAHLLVTLEALTGIIGVGLVASMSFAKFSRPTARVLFSDKAVIGLRDGVPHLMFRMANSRHNAILEAQLRVFVLLVQRTAEGDLMRIPTDLALVRERTALFAMTWTAMHRIDSTSPFHGADALDRLRTQRAELYLTLTGFDDTLSQTIHARCAYAIDDIAMNARFADVLTVLEDGTRVIDYAHFHEVVSIGAENP